MKIDRILETVLYAADIDAARGFYTRVLGLVEYSYVADRFVFFRVGPGMLLIFNPWRSIAQSGPDAAPMHGATGPGHVAFCIQPEEIAEAVAHLESHGVPIERRIDWPGGGHSIYFRDPAGNSLEFATESVWRKPTDRPPDESNC